ncbi:MAG: Holliday junction resolvase RuvX [Candidatus Aadella gelida]|nr:Holliday junction resolvase RuvX [Candidatus Aadella gelida]
MRIMGLDIGTKNIGVAVSDETCTLAQGREVITRTSTEKVVSRIKELVEEFKVEEIVIGLPVNMDGTEGPRAKDSRMWGELLEKRFPFKCVLWDERLSTKEAEDIMISADISRKKRKKKIDQLAAQLILQGYLDDRSRIKD